MKIIVCQHGSRHRYAIPNILFKNNMLCCFYTDSCDHSLLGKLSSFFTFVPSGRIKRLAKRQTRLPSAYVKASDVTLLGKTSLEKHDLLSKKMIKWGVRDAGMVYSMYNEDLHFIEFAKKKGLKIVIDVYISPLANYLAACERKRVEGQDAGSLCFSEYLPPRLKECIDLADVLICPSEFVAEGIRKCYPSASDKIRICAYGSSLKDVTKKRKVVSGRFFFAGNEPVRKGLWSYAEAASVLKQQFPNLDFRVAGITDVDIIHDPHYKDLTFLGKLSAERMLDEYLSAEAFVLPTVAEGMASVCVEALSAGCPIIVPPSAGIDPVNGKFGGILLKENTLQELLDAIRSFLADSSLRQECSRKALEVSGYYSIESWSERLTAIFKSL